MVHEIRTQYGDFRFILNGASDGLAYNFNQEKLATSPQSSPQKSVAAPPAPHLQTSDDLSTAKHVALFGIASSIFFNVVSAQALGAKSLLIQRAGLAGIGGFYVTASFTAGFLIGTGIDYLPKVWGGKRVSDYTAKGLEHLFGPPSQGFINGWEYYVEGGWWKETCGWLKKVL